MKRLVYLSLALSLFSLAVAVAVYLFCAAQVASPAIPETPKAVAPAENPSTHQVRLTYRDIVTCNLFHKDGTPVWGDDKWVAGDYNATCYLTQKREE